MNYEIAAGLTGKAKATTADGSPAEGSFVVTITDKPPTACVDSRGRVVEGEKCGPAQGGEAGAADQAAPAATPRPSFRRRD